MTTNLAYENYRTTMMEIGARYQDFIVDLFISKFGWPLSIYGSKTYQLGVGESRQGIEIKHDQRYAETGNIYIEIAEKARPRDGDLVPSGIYRRDNSWLYVIGDYDTVFAFAINWLRMLDKSRKYKTKKIETSEGFLLPDDDARRYAAFVLKPKTSEVVSKYADDLKQLGHELYLRIKERPDQLTFFEE